MLCIITRQEDHAEADGYTDPAQNGGSILVGIEFAWRDVIWFDMKENFVLVVNNLNVGWFRPEINVAFIIPNAYLYTRMKSLNIPQHWKQLGTSNLFRASPKAHKSCLQDSNEKTTHDKPPIALHERRKYREDRGAR